MNERKPWPENPPTIKRAGVRAVILIPGAPPFDVMAPSPTPREWIAGQLDCQWIESVVMGGLPERTDSATRAFAFVDEEGKRNGRAPNSTASVLSRIGQVIVGAAVVFGGVDGDGEPLGLTDEQFAAVIAAADEFAL